MGPSLRRPTQGRSCQTGLMEPRGSKPPAFMGCRPNPLERLAGERPINFNQVYVDTI